jgi:hypothetical protein
MKTNIELAIIRYAVVCEKWKSIGGTYPILGAFICGWFMRDMNGENFVDVSSQFRDSYRVGWNEADTMLKIEEQK